MKSRRRGVLFAALLFGALLTGVYANGHLNSVEEERNARVEICESLPEYDFERMLSRTERITGQQLQRNLSICVERTDSGIDTTPNQAQFAFVEEDGLRFFELDERESSTERSSLGHTTVSPDGGPVEVFLANQTVVENVPWLSYEALVVHELSDAIGIPAANDGTTTGSRSTAPQTTDEVLARQAVSNGVSLYVADVYIDRYGGHLNVSALSAPEQQWKRQITQSMYYSGYRYSKQLDQRSVRGTDIPESTAQLLHPNETEPIDERLESPNVSTTSLERVHTDRVGELFLRETLESKGISPSRATAATDGWTNDRMDYYRSSNATVVTWRVTWERASQATEFVDTYAEVYDFERVSTLSPVSCDESGRYLALSEKTVTVAGCTT
ncbi:hypothetical protein [Halorussus amylolyticus]|uniref:hypothetical protein n=1 Tax=Halorussus amylolyticus TaxID=1126242 RepID=UPI0010538B44|nr:hypothetical protein [Halorussus amylolyticus]